MNAWLFAAIGMMCCLIPCGIACLRGQIMDRVVGLETAGLLTTLLLLLLCEVYHRPPFSDLALTLALLSFGGGLVFVRFLERWM